MALEQTIDLNSISYASLLTSDKETGSTCNVMAVVAAVDHISTPKSVKKIQNLHVMDIDYALIRRYYALFKTL